MACKDVCMRDSLSSMKRSHKIISLIHTTNEINDKIPQKNTRCDIRKTPTNVTVKTPQFNDDAKKDSFNSFDSIAQSINQE